MCVFCVCVCGSLRVYVSVCVCVCLYAFLFCTTGKEDGHANKRIIARHQAYIVPKT